MMELVCPGCQGSKEIPDGAKVGDIIDCQMCAGMKFRLSRDEGGFVLAPVYYVSCPGCDKTMEVPDGSRAGDIMECCGEKYRLTYEFGSWALEK